MDKKKYDTVNLFSRLQYYVHVQCIIENNVLEYCTSFFYSSLQHVHFVENM